MEEEGRARTRILDAAEHLFAQRGFDATATSAVAKAAQVPKGLLFYYFPTKKDILSALVGERLGFDTIDVGPLTAPGDPVQSLLNLSEKLFEAQAASAVLRVILWREELTHPEVKANLAAHRQSLYAAIEQVLTRSLSGSEIDPKALRAAALAWVAMVTTKPLEDQLRGSGAMKVRDPRDDLASVAELLCAGLRRGSETQTQPA
ncbi:TetR/AcrR family transcriptional regulator [Sinomonas terrae]|uniref:TetR/AcrR family transcriptional regulator n=1 Tax=Sinomonas terrae TaxID=2908838 RepID=A0ABS9TZN6_9MICC|nr:TetR/AcrR family transcriptional regulator [Sinomonas terrae]MCH6469888.1 TetR/AcrR family transcriptional regulator [Sinomonas terrae]